MWVSHQALSEEEGANFVRQESFDTGETRDSVVSMEGALPRHGHGKTHHEVAAQGWGRRRRSSSRSSYSGVGPWWRRRPQSGSAEVQRAG